MNRFAAIPAALGASLLFGLPAQAQMMDIVPSYHPEGPVEVLNVDHTDLDSEFIEAFYNEPIVLEVSLPGLNHEDSLAVAGNFITFLAISATTSPIPLPLGPEATVYVDLGTLVLLPVPTSLEIPVMVNITAPFPPEILVPIQVVTIDLFDPLLTIQTSNLIEVNLLEPLPQFPDEMKPKGSAAAGTSTVTFDMPSNRYLFNHDDGSGGITEYVLDLNDSNVANGTIEIFESTSGYFPVRDAGFQYTQNAGQVLFFPIQFQFLGTHTLTNHSLSGNTVTTEFTDVVPTLSGGTVTHMRRISYTLEGKSLKIQGEHLNADPFVTDTFFAFSLGDVGASILTTFEELQIPYMDQIGVSLLDNQTFVSTYLDLFQSSSQRHEPSEFFKIPFLDFARNTERAVYFPFTDGSSIPVNETGWVTVTDDVTDTFVQTTAPKSPFADDFAPNVAVAFSRDTTGSNMNLYKSDEANMDRMVSWGMTDITCWKVHWMNFGQNRRATTHVPARPEGGTDAELASFVSSSVANGWRVAMYTDFYSLDQAQGFDDNPNYSENPPGGMGQFINFDDGVKDENGDFRLGFGLVEQLGVPGSTVYNTRLLAPKRAFNHFDREANTMVGTYGANANYYDVMTISSPDLVVTAGGQNQGIISGDVRSPNDRTLKDAINSYKYLYSQTAARVNGPIVAEGGFFDPRLRFDSMYAGYIDGAWRTLSTGGDPSLPGFSGQEFLVLPDYEIQCVRPLMPGVYGMGQYPRFFVPQSPLVGFPIVDGALQEYRATEISYMHNGFFMSLSLPDNGDDFLTFAEQIKTYYSFRSLHDEWNAASSQTVEYRNPGAGMPYMDLSDAIRSNYDFVDPILRITYDTGLVVFVNHQPTVEQELGFDVPRWGWVIQNTNTGYSNLAVNDALGNFMHHVISPTYEMADGNGVGIDFGGLPGGPIGGAIGVSLNLTVVRTSSPTLLVENPDGSITVTP